MSELRARSYKRKDCVDNIDCDKSISIARDILMHESSAIHEVADNLNESFAEAVELLHHRTGSTIVVGMGKAGLIGQKIAATLASTGNRSHFLHPGEAMHGDLGRVAADDVALVLSFSGETDEVIRVLTPLKLLGVKVISITGNADSSLALRSDIVLEIGGIREAGSLALAPSTSTTAMLALGDAIALTLSEQQHFQADDFAKFHPGGNLGRRLARVEDVMRPIEKCRLAVESDKLRTVLSRSNGQPRRSGAVMVVDQRACLVGIFTDSDLARLLAAKREQMLDQPILEAMTRNPLSIPMGSKLAEAVKLLSDKKISELPIVDGEKPVGMIDITDILDVGVSEHIEPNRDSIAPSATDDDASDSISILPFPNSQQG